MEGQDLTTGDVRKQLWSLAWPLMLSIFFYTLYNIVDAYWVSLLSAEAIAAVSISQITLFAMIALGFGVTAGSGVIMAMHIGAKNIKEAERVLGQSFVLMTILALFFTVIALTFRSTFLVAAGAGGSIFAPALEYFTIIAAGSILLFILIAIIFAFNSQGDTFTLTKLFALTTGMNLVLDPIMIFGWFGFPALGISGAAYATLISMGVFNLIAIRSLSSPKRRIRFYFHNLNVKWESVRKVLGIGFPAALTQLVFPIGLAALTFIISLNFLEPGAIAFTLGFRVEMFAYLPAFGFGFAALAMIGQNIGAGNIERSKEVLRKALLYGFVLATAFGVTAALLGPFLIAVFTSEPIVTGYALSYMRTVTLSFGFLAVLMVEASAFQAIGRPWPGLWIFLLKFVVISIPLAFVLTTVFGFPILAVWTAIIAGNIVASAVGYVWITRTMKKLDLTRNTVHPPSNEPSVGKEK